MAYTTYSDFEQQLTAIDRELQSLRSGVSEFAGGSFATDPTWINYMNGERISALENSRNNLIAEYERAAALNQPSPTPISVPASTTTSNPTTFSVKQPSPSLVQYDVNTLPQELIEDLLYEQVGGHELISMARHDTINGQNISYSLIKNLSIINQIFNPNNIVANQSSYTLKLGEYALDISNKIPDPGSNDYPNGVAYLDSDGNLVIELTSINQGELLEARITSDGTIYKIGE